MMSSARRVRRPPDCQSSTPTSGVLPADWGRTLPPQKFALPDDERALLDRYCGVQSSVQFASVLDYVGDLSADRVYIESPYVDFDYRSEYSNLYARSFDPPS